MLKQDVTSLFADSEEPKPIKVSEFKPISQETSKRAITPNKAGSNDWLVAIMAGMMIVVMLQALPILINLSTELSNRVNSLIASTQVSRRPF